LTTRIASLVALAVLGACRSQPSGSAPSRDAAAASAPEAAATPAVLQEATDAAPVDVPLALPTAPHRFQKMALTNEQLATLVAAAPELARAGPDVAFFEPGDGNYLTRSKAAHEDFIFTSQPVVWTAKDGVRVLALSAHTKENSFVAAWTEVPGGLRLQSAFLMMNELSPIALAYRKNEPDLWWTSCWMCPGETGHVSVREDGHVVIVQE
jgi:hypothetical protein